MKTKILLKNATAAVALLASIAIPAKAYDAPVKGATFTNHSNYFTYTTTDPLNGHQVSADSPVVPGVPSTYTISPSDDGVFYIAKAFDNTFGGEHNYFGFATFDPIVGQWKQWDKTYGSANGTTTFNDGTAAFWVEDGTVSHVNVGIYDPDSHSWITDTYFSQSSGSGHPFWGGIGFVNAHGVVCWSYALDSSLNLGVVEYAVYDPKRKLWMHGSDFTNHRGIVQNDNGTVFFYLQSGRFAGVGYNAAQGRWVLDQTTGAISSFRVGGSYDHNHAAARWAIDMSIGANSTLDWGDGTSASGTSGLHNYADVLPRTLTQTVSGWHGDSDSSTVSINQNFNQPPSPSISIDGKNYGDVVTRPYGGSTTVTVHYAATDPNGNLAGIRYNIWNATTGYFDNGGGGFAPQSGGSGEVVKTVTLDTNGDWYFWTDAQDDQGAYASTGDFGSGFKITVVEGSPPNSPPSPTISVEGQSYGAVVTRPYGGSTTVTVHYAATDPDGNLAGIRYNIWNATTGYFDNGGGFVSQSGGSGDVVKTITLDSSGDWYFWTDAQDAAGAYASTGDWGSGFKITVVEGSPPSNNPPSASISVEGYSYGSVITRPFGGSVTVTVHYAATDPDGNLAGIRYNIWNASTGYFDNGGSFVPQSGSSGDVVKTFTLDSDGDWYFWTDAQDTTGAYTSTGDWGGGLRLTVVEGSP